VFPLVSSDMNAGGKSTKVHWYRSMLCSLNYKHSSKGNKEKKDNIFLPLKVKLLIYNWFSTEVGVQKKKNCSFWVANLMKVLDIQHFFTGHKECLQKFFTALSDLFLATQHCYCKTFPAFRFV
jgi:hypothetical protein